MAAIRPVAAMGRSYKIGGCIQGDPESSADNPYEPRKSMLMYS